MVGRECDRSVIDPAYLSFKAKLMIEEIDGEAWSVEG